MTNDEQTFLRIQELERANASLLAQVKAWEDKAGEVPEPKRYFLREAHGYEGGLKLMDATPGVKYDHDTLVSSVDYDALSAALVVARKENEGLKEWHKELADDFSSQLNVAITARKAAEAESAGMREALRELLDALEQEAKAKMSAQVASDNYSNPIPDVMRAGVAMIHASEAVAKARALLAPRREKEQQ